MVSCRAAAVAEEHVLPCVGAEVVLGPPSLLRAWPNPAANPGKALGTGVALSIPRLHDPNSEDRRMKNKIPSLPGVPELRPFAKAVDIVSSSANSMAVISIPPQARLCPKRVIPEPQMLC